MLFAIDAELNIPYGFRYTSDCRNPNASNFCYCVSHIGCSSGCAGDSAALPSDGGANGGFFAGLGDSDGGAD